VKCPVCPDATLLMAERQGVEIDYCPACRGVWLDRGELDKLIQLSGRQEAASSQATLRSLPPSAGRPEFEDSDFGKRHRADYRKKSWLSDIFD
jgi:Zn-finger nucleic acid-binding protein